MDEETCQLAVSQTVSWTSPLAKDVEIRVYGVDLEKEFLRTMDDLERGTAAKTEQDY